MPHMATGKAPEPVRRQKRSEGKLGGGPSLCFCGKGQAGQGNS